MHEFDIIRHYFAPLACDAALQDDAAYLRAPHGYELVVTTDSLHAGRHFIGDEPAGDIARKALRVNLSDLAAMGADPYAYQLALALPDESTEARENWLAGFARGLSQEQAAHGLTLSGGDLTATPGPLSITITAMGLVPEGQAVSRGGARAGDSIILTGPVGDSMAGLTVRRGHADIPESMRDAFIQRYRLPAISTAIAGVVRSYANAAIDISDGLYADLGHLCAASGVSAEIDTENIPLSNEIRYLLDTGGIDRRSILTGGDDYKLLLAVPDTHINTVTQQAKSCHCSPAIIGHFKDSGQETPRVTVRDGTGKPLHPVNNGWRHF